MAAAAPATLALRVVKRRSDMSGRMYAVRSMPKFLRGHMARQEVEFSKSFTYQPQWMEFTQPQMPLLRLLCEIFTTIEPAERAGYKLVGDARFLPIPPLMMARLLRILSACPFKLTIGDKEFDIAEMRRDDLPLRAALDTAGQPFRPDDPAYLAAFDRLMANTSLVILDLKEIAPERHRQHTGKDNANILAMARRISDLGIPLWVRHVLVPGLTDDEEGLRKTADFIRSLKTVQRVEVLPYHTLGLFKWQKLGIPYPLPDAVPPTAEQVKRAEELLEVSRYPG